MSNRSLYVLFPSPASTGMMNAYCGGEGIGITTGEVYKEDGSGLRGTPGQSPVPNAIGDGTPFSNFYGCSGPENQLPVEFLRYVECDQVAAPGVDYSTGDPGYENATDDETAVPGDEGWGVS